MNITGIKSFYLPSLAVILFFLFFTISLENVNAQSVDIIYINNGANGGDCYLIGTWDVSTETCLLKTDIQKSIEIDSDGITLDGNNHAVVGPGIYGFGITRGIILDQRSNVVLKNLKISGFWRGVSMERASSNALLNNVLRGNGWGIYLISESSNNNIIKNIVTGNTLAGLGLQGYHLSGNIIAENDISGNFEGILFRYASGNIIKENNIKNNIFGLSDFFESTNNQLYNNDFIDNTTQTYLNGPGSNTFNLQLPTGGNYWSNFDTSSEGCVDANNDNVCDTPYSFNGGVDYLPWAKKMDGRLSKL